MKAKTVKVVYAPVVREKKKQGAVKKAPWVNNSRTSADSITIAAADQAPGRSCIMETPLARYVRRRLQSALTK